MVVLMWRYKKNCKCVCLSSKEIWKCINALKIKPTMGHFDTNLILTWRIQLMSWNNLRQKKGKERVTRSVAWLTPPHSLRAYPKSEAFRSVILICSYLSYNVCVLPSLVSFKIRSLVFRLNWFTINGSWSLTILYRFI